MYKNDVPKCMNKYLESFTAEFSKMIREHGNEFRSVQCEQREIIYASKFSWIVYAVAFAIGFVPGKNEAVYDVTFHFYAGVFLFVLAVILVISVCNSEYKKAVKKKLFPKLLSVFSKDIKYCPKGGAISSSIFDKSKLLKREVHYVDTDDTKDVFSGEYNGVYFRACEVDITWDNGKTGKQREESTLFHGLALYFVLEKNIDANVHIYSKSIFNKTPKGYEKVEFESEKFNKKYDVYAQSTDNTEGQIEARYLLNVAFLERLMSLQTAFRVRKMRCSVFDDNMVILLYTTKDLFEINHLFRDVRDLKQYKHLFNEFASVLSFIDVLNLASKTKL